MKLTTKWGLLLFVSLFPLLILVLAGVMWLMERDLLLIWLGVMGVVSLGSWFVTGKLKQVDTTPTKLNVKPNPNWSAKGDAAWQTVETIARRVRQENPDLESWNRLWDLLKEVVQAVAHYYYPDEEKALLEIRVPYFLRVIELLARDLRITFSENIPGSHILTVNDVIRGHRLSKRGRDLYQLYRLVSAGVDPISAAIREVRGVAVEKMLQSSSQEIKLWLMDAYIKKIGYYAIQLYSGHIVLDEDAFKQHVTTASRDDLERFQNREEKLAEEPLRILVLGQVKAGKSSLINALFGEVKAMVDVVPTTSTVYPYLLERQGLETAIILDTAGYQDSDNPKRPLTEARKEVLRSDLILMVCSARSAARHADHLLLQELRLLFQQHTEETLPSILVVLTYIDQLRPFREWNPPYDVNQSDNPKARMIRSTMETVATDLDIALDRVIPVCLKPGQEYNIQEGLIPAILQTLDDAQRLKYLRCLRDYNDLDYWKQLWTQSKSAGKIVVRGGIDWLAKRARQVDRWGRF
jgi:small GTP-binding protein